MTILPTTTRLPKVRAKSQAVQPEVPVQLPQPGQIVGLMAGLLLLMLVSSVLAQLL